MKLWLLAAAVVAAVAAFAIPSSATAVTPIGTWELIPAQSDTVGTPVPSYKTAVRQPINADGSSVFGAKRGVVPVQFDVISGTATPHTIGPVVFESIKNGNDPTTSSTGPYAWSALVFTPSTAMTFNDVTSLVSHYQFTTGDCYVGSLRWTIDITHNGVEKQIHAYYGTPNGPDQGCSGNASGSGDNLVTTGITPDRFEFQGAGSPVYTTYDAVKALANDGTDTVNWIGLILESGWLADQVINPATLTASVNGDDWVRETAGTTYTYSDLAPTCDIPQAKIVVTKTDGDNPGAVDESNSVQPKDTGLYFRNVDCKLIYNLDVSTLRGTGSYTVGADFGLGAVLDPAIFGLK